MLASTAIRGALLAAALATASVASAAPGGYLGVLLREGERTLTARTAGRVVAVQARLGERVRAGDVLVRLDDEEARRRAGIALAALQAAEAQAARARAELSASRTRLTRREAASELVSREELELAREEVKVAESELKRATAAEEQARLEHEAALADLAATRVTAPFAGVVAESPLVPGARVGEGDPLARLVGDGALRVRFAVPEPEVDAVPAGRRVLVRGENGAPELSAVVERVAPGVDEPSGMIFVEALIDDDAGAAATSSTVVRVRPAAD